MDESQIGHGGGPASHSSRRAGVLMVALGAVAAATGLVLFLLPGDQASFGWYAYAPLSDSTFIPPDGLSPRNQIGVVVFVVGLVVLAFGAGWMLGHSRAASQRPLPDPRSPGI